MNKKINIFFCIFFGSGNYKSGLETRGMVIKRDVYEMRCSHGLALTSNSVEGGPWIHSDVVYRVSESKDNII